MGVTYGNRSLAVRRLTYPFQAPGNGPPGHTSQERERKPMFGKTIDQLDAVFKPYVKEIVDALYIVGGLCLMILIGLLVR